ncbi:acetoin dehydrogenase-like protein [Amylocarpus encephaloides]|uniref:Acetoin dehydrogenase-like protein n=1 Tax=Amylocarpus encephaloides TaxID=45428 RepID=A0A9P7YGC0_9HELO|nr:acetoin dehydrogenase-like protein [Amylocarpus encephaloides]
MARNGSSSSTAVMKDYGKRTVIVTGSARCIGKAIAIRLAEDGYDVCVNDIAANQSGIDGTMKETQQLGRKSYGHAADVSKLSEVEALIEASVKNLGDLNVMIANASIAQFKAILDLSEDDVRRMFGIIVLGVFNCYSAAAKQMVKQGSGGKPIGCSRIGSSLLFAIVAFKPFTMMSHYSASKWASRGFTQAFAMEMAEHKVTVSGYAPGLLVQRCGTCKKTGDKKRDTIKKYTDDLIALRRTTVPKDVSKCVSYLASPDSDYMAGQTLIIDGGIQFS